MPYKSGEKEYTLPPRVWDPSTLVNDFDISYSPMPNNKYIMSSLLSTHIWDVSNGSFIQL